eukprot:TRINITY_DN3321_c1_g1_i1.p1 TRINITY_DN3321_c1_g1~~TRINITY_DN3321_c1_g1_i1.p1  ORF type:complete len:910 (-),score=401.87 TRINITY_DN3321_c1_g1_i1:235-2778(-)
MLEVPRLGRKNNPDEPWAWQSREFLRNLIIGKPITFTVEFKQESGRRFCIVHLGEENILKTVVEAGWARVRQPPDGKGPRNDLHAELLAAMAAAEESKIGIFQPVSKKSTRPVHKNVDAIGLFEKIASKPLDAIVEYVRDASCMKVELLKTHHAIMVQLAGVQAPTFDRNDAGQYTPKPFAREAKYFTETHLLNRTVRVQLLGVAKNDTFQGRIAYQGRDLGLELLNVGLAKFVRWNAPKGAEAQLQEAEAAAKAKKLRIWHAYEESEDEDAEDCDGKICEIQNRGILSLKRGDTHEVETLHLSSILVPSMGSHGRRNEDEPMSWEAREFLRQRLIGKKVQARKDYVREAMTTRDGRELPERSFYSVFYDGSKNVSLELVEAGLARVMSHSDSNRSADYQDLVMAEKQAQSKSKGIWKYNQKSGKTSSGEAYSFKLNDLTVREKKEDGKTADNRKSRQLLPFLQRAGRVPAVVEYVLSSAKLKIRIPREGCMIFFAFEAVRTPRQEEEFGKESYDFVRNRLYQRDVEIEVSGMDKGGNFLGALFLGRKNFAVQMLEGGLAKIIPPAAERCAYGVELSAAEQAAKDKKRKLWKDYDEAAETAAREARRAARQQEDGARQPNREIIKVMVTEILGGGQFYAQKLDDEVVLTDLMATLNASEPSTPPPTFAASLKKGVVALGKFSDGKWYRAKVLALSDDGEEAHVLYIDYGNEDFVRVSAMRECPEAVLSIPPQALECMLAFVRVPGQFEDFGEEAGLFLRDLMFGKRLTANVEARDGDRLHLSIGDEQSKDLVNAEMVRAGFATVQRRSLGYNAALIKSLNVAQESARKNRLGMWVYGDIPDEDLDEK